MDNSETFARLIHVLRGRRVMLDADLARIYGVSTARLNQQVQRNLDRFPPDFMFRLSADEAALMLQIATSNRAPGRGGRRKLPRAFTQEGVAMLSSVLRSPRAIKANIAIMRGFVRMSQLLSESKDLAAKLSELERRYTSHDAKLKIIFDELRAMREFQPPDPPDKPAIGFKP